MTGVSTKGAATRLNTVVVGYFLAVLAAAGAGLTLFLAYGVAMNHQFGRGAPQQSLPIGLLALILLVACFVTFAGGLLPFAAMLWRTERSKSRRPWPYVFVCGAGCCAEFLFVVPLASAGNGYLAFTAQSAVFGALWFGLSGAVGGLAYWLYARGRPPMSNWTD